MENYKNCIVSEAPKVYIIIVNWNGWKDTIECLESIYRSEYKNFQIIVVDNGSDNNSLDYIKLWAGKESKNIPFVAYSAQIEKDYKGGNVEESLYENNPELTIQPLTLIESSFNLGFGGGNNLGLRYILSKKDYGYIWMLNNDTTVNEKSLSLMVDTMDKKPGIVGSVLMYYDKPANVQAYGGGYLSLLTGQVKTENRNKPKKLDFITGASLMIDRNSFLKVGLFDENIFMYFEDIEYCMRAKASNIHLNVSDAIVYHKVGASSGKDESYFAWFNGYKSKFYSLLKHKGLGFWFICFFGVLIFNIINPKTKADKRMASKDVFFYYLKKHKVETFV
ncbi:MAG: glycosyltransferase family 2 protein [Candidatus Omnitrophica bacterium]|nr:glycosyltransferase family 2 protein [Candidatus Omnitrophota bacterium]